MVAPLIAAALTPLVQDLFSKGLTVLGNAVLSKGQQVVEEKLGVKLEAPQTPEQLQAYRQMEIDHEEFLITANLEKAAQELEQIKEDNKNTDSARKHDEEIQKTPHASYLAKNTAYILDFIIVITTFLMMVILFFKGVPAENKEFFYMTLGSLLTMCVTVVNFHRGSSSRSASKDMTIASLAKNVG